MTLRATHDAQIPVHSVLSAPLKLLHRACYSFVGIASTNMAPAFQPIAFSTMRFNPIEPCSLLTSEYLETNCTRSLDMYRYGPIGSGVYECGDEYPWEGYSSAYAACGAVTASIQLRNMGYAAVSVSFNAVLYVLFKECTRDMGKQALSKLTRGKTDARTSVIFALTGIALVCNPLFLVYMLLSPALIFKVELAGMLSLIVGFNVLCWVVIGLLLNLEFVVAKFKAEVDFDVMISYRVWSDAGLAQDLYRTLTGQGLRAYLDKECLKDGEPWEEGSSPPASRP